jgi:predicted membrane protein (TIGR00267 family)
MMAEEFQLAPIDERKALKTSIVVGIAAIVGSLIPLLPFFLLPVSVGILVSIIVAGLTLFVVGAYKSRVMAVGHWRRSGLQMAVIGLAAALVGYGVGLFFRAPSG